MTSTLPAELSSLSLLPTTVHHHQQLPCVLSSQSGLKFSSIFRCSVAFQRDLSSHRPLIAAASSTVTSRSLSERNGFYTVGDFMTPKEELHVVNPTTTVDEALEALVEHRITGFPVVDEHWKLVGVVSDFDLLALDSISGTGKTDADIFPQVDSNWKTFNEVQKLLSKTNGKLVGDVMTPAPVVVRESTNLEDAARLLLKTKYRRLPVVDGVGKLVGIITRGNVVRAALKIKKASETYA